MKNYSSTSIGRFTKHCPAALGFMEDGAPEFRDIFQAGIAAHAVLQVIGEKGATEPEQQQAVAQAVVEELITKGRAFKGTPEPPMQPEDALEGRDLALAWLTWNELPAGQQETVLAMDEAGNACPPGAHRYDAIIDLVYHEDQGGEDWSAQAVVVRDYKTSWQADASELNTLQRKGQAVLAWIHNPDADIIGREVVNLRTGATYREDIQLDDEGIATLTQWRKDILTVCNAADVTRAARPGVGCISCPYVLHCEDCRALLDNPERPAVQYAAAKGIADELAKQLRVQTKENPQPVGDDGMIGYQATMSRQVNFAELGEQIDALWSGGMVGLVLALQPGVTAVDKLAKVLFPGKEGKPAREDFLEAVTGPKPGSRFTTWKVS